jgi:NAD(P)-dependent dehydrogenase (short-subunit alcohol dehydrogenase family)
VVPDKRTENPGRKRGCAKKALTPDLSPEASNDKSAGEGQDHHVERFALSAIARALPEDTEQLDFPDTHSFVILGSAAAISDGLIAALSLQGYSVLHLKPGSQTRCISEQEFEVDFSSEETATELKSLLDDDIPPGAVINLLNLDTNDTIADDNVNDVLFLVLKLFATELQASISSSAGWLLNFTRLDGKFGLAGNNATGQMNIEQAGSLGISKSLAREWPDLRVKCIDIEPDIEPHMMLALVLEELQTANKVVEVGVHTEGRFELELTRARQRSKKPLELDSDSVILITGGAYGITAKFARHFASQFQSRLVIIGRSEEPDDEAADTATLNTENDLRNFLISRARSEGENALPAKIERELKGLLKNREIRENFAHIRRAGSNISYYSADISDANSFMQVIEDCYSEFGRIDGVLHGAGIISDRLLKAKPLEAFQSVMATKTVAARVLLKTLNPEFLKFVMFFSSVAARFGNVGQTDYSAANEILNKTAERMSANWPEARCLSINWGPWNAGMVSQALSELYAGKGIHLIPPGIGLEMGMQEVLENRDVETLIAADIDKISQWGLG